MGTPHGTPKQKKRGKGQQQRQALKLQVPADEARNKAQAPLWSRTSQPKSPLRTFFVPTGPGACPASLSVCCAHQRSMRLLAANNAKGRQKRQTGRPALPRPIWNRPFPRPSPSPPPIGRLIRISRSHPTFSHFSPWARFRPALYFFSSSPTAGGGTREALPRPSVPRRRGEKKKG